MKNWKGTKGEAKIKGGATEGTIQCRSNLPIYVDKKELARVYGESPQQAVFNATLFADALNTVNKCDLMPSELLKQRDEAVKLIKEHTENGTGYTISQDDINPMLTFLSKIQIEG